ncbi:hypothetical protein QA596_09815 [Balneolales bacterium ANBcel1]|nr:hypothetical protein [Balneolales bacterium ANBcel1]
MRNRITRPPKQSLAGAMLVAAMLLCTVTDSRAQLVPAGPDAADGYAVSLTALPAMESEVSYNGNDMNRPSPVGALLRSFVVPGWGHHYVDSDNWRMGQYHLAAEVVLLASWLGINRQSSVLEKNMYTHAAAYSGVDIRAYGREFELAVGNYRSYDAYIENMERTRNWHRLEDFPDSPVYRWEWESEALQNEYRDLRSRRDNLDQQLPAIAAIMVVNRVLSGVSAFNRARSFTGGQASLHLAPGPEHQGVQAHVRVSF